MAYQDISKPVFLNRVLEVVESEDRRVQYCLSGFVCRSDIIKPDDRHACRAVALLSQISALYDDLESELRKMGARSSVVRVDTYSVKRP